MSQKVNNPDNTIAFQGIPGAYSEMACLSNFNTMETLALSLIHISEPTRPS